MSTDLYAEKYKDYPKEELLDIINNASNFGQFARLGAIQALEAQNGNSVELESLKNIINGITEKEVTQETPTLYSKMLIRMFALFFGTIFGVILLMYNMKVTKNNTGRWQVLAFGILFIGIELIIKEHYGLSPYISILINFIGAIILIDFFWNKFIGREIKHAQKNWIKPTIIVLSIIIPLFIYMRSNGLV